MTFPSILIEGNPYLRREGKKVNRKGSIRGFQLFCLAQVFWGIVVLLLVFFLLGPCNSHGAESEWKVDELVYTHVAPQGHVLNILTLTDRGSYIVLCPRCGVIAKLTVSVVDIDGKSIVQIIDRRMNVTYTIESSGDYQKDCQWKVVSGGPPITVTKDMPGIGYDLLNSVKAHYLGIVRVDEIA